METLPFGLFFVYTLFFTISESNAYRRDASSKFANLLKNIVSINERRFEAMKELARLQEYSVTKYQLRSGRENFEFEERIRNSKGPLVIFIVERDFLNSDDSQESLESFEDDRSIDDAKSSDFDTIEEDDKGRNLDDYVDGKGALRRWKGCSKEAAKVCKKACREAAKNVCSDYSCKSRMKKAFKKECKSACKSRFTIGSYKEEEE